jgi:two-component system cell cycle sensor histidine kinase/response regulator CckA
LASESGGVNERSEAGRLEDLPARLQQSGKLAAALLGSAGQAILAVDSRGTIVLANGRAADLFGYSRQELLGAPMDILLPESRRGAHENQRGDYFARPRVRPMGIGMDLVARRKDGAEFPVEVSLSHIQTNEGDFAIAFISDISRRKLLEQQLLHAQKMEAVGRLAGGVAHDFNNMLTVISGYTRMILDDLPPGDPLRDSAEEVRIAADRAAALTNQLLAFSRRQLMRPQALNVNETLTNIENMLRRLIGEDLALSLSLAPDLGNIRADPSHIEQAIVNLVVNARDAMPSGGRVAIETANVQLDSIYARTHLGVHPGEFVMIAVTDTGHGMDAETRQHIFEPFFTTKGKGKGTGLGLATVYGMVKQCGGDIWVYSEQEKGTAFKLYFPRIAEASAGKGGRPEAAMAHGDETILVVEDEAAVRDLSVKILSHLGYRVLSAASGQEALEIATANQEFISLLLTDVVMPGMSGKQLADQLLPMRPGMKVLFLSGYTENTIINHGVLEPGVDFLPKPFSREALAGKIREVLSGIRKA